MTPGDIADDKKAVAWSFLLPDTPSKSIRNRTKADENKRVKKPKVELDEQDEVDREMARLLPSDDEAGPSTDPSPTVAVVRRRELKRKASALFDKPAAKKDKKVASL